MKRESTHHWMSGLWACAKDPRAYFFVAVAIVALGLLLNAPDDPSVRGIYIASAVAISIAALPQAIGVWADHAQTVAARRTEEWKGRDEARRVCLIAWIAPSPEALATAVNALTYHAGHMDIDEARALLVSGRGNPLNQHVKHVLEGQINRLCVELGQEPMFQDADSSGG